MAPLAEVDGRSAVQRGLIWIIKVAWGSGIIYAKLPCVSTKVRPSITQNEKEKTHGRYATQLCSKRPRSHLVPLYVPDGIRGSSEILLEVGTDLYQRPVSVVLRQLKHADVCRNEFRHRCHYVDAIGVHLRSY